MPERPSTDHDTTPATHDDATVVQVHEIPAHIRALATIADPDYIDLFTLATDATAAGTPHQWARAAFEKEAGPAGQFVWRVLLGLRLAWRSAPTQVAGWRIAGQGHNWLTLEARSWMLTGNLVVHLDDDQMAMATAISYDRPIAERVWTRLSRSHRRLAPALLRDARTTLAQTQR